MTPANVASLPFGGSQASERPNADETATTSDFFIRPENNTDGCENSEKPANDGASDARTDKNPKTDDVRVFGGNGATEFRSDIADAYAELELREAAADDLTIPPGLDRRHETCAHCGQSGGTEWDYRGVTVRLHEHCEQSWVDAHRQQA